MSQKSESPVRRRVGDLIGLPVRFSDGSSAGYVNDVRLRPSGRVVGSMQQLVTSGIVVGRHQNGSMLGYDRNRDQGPAIVRALVRRRYRDSGFVPWASVAGVDLDQGVVRLSVSSLEDLGHP